jgi:hypothetical protein
LGPKGGATLGCEGGSEHGGPNSDEGTDTLALCVYCNPSTHILQKSDARIPLRVCVFLHIYILIFNFQGYPLELRQDIRLVLHFYVKYSINLEIHLQNHAETRKDAVQPS